jgi:hypothetical protein
MPRPRLTVKRIMIIGIPLNRPTGTFSPTGGEGSDEGVRFMKSPHFNFHTHWDHEPCSGVSVSAVECWVMRTTVTDRRYSERFMERENIQDLDVNRCHEPILTRRSARAENTEKTSSRSRRVGRPLSLMIVKLPLKIPI